MNSPPPVPERCNTFREGTESTMDFGTPWDALLAVSDKNVRQFEISLQVNRTSSYIENHCIGWAFHDSKPKCCSVDSRTVYWWAEGFALVFMTTAFDMLLTPRQYFFIPNYGLWWFFTSLRTRIRMSEYAVEACSRKNNSDLNFSESTLKY